MKLYDLPASPNARRVRIFIAEKGLEIPTEVVDMVKYENHTPEYLAKNPLGKMPLLELDDGTCIAESAAICRYLEEIYPEPPLFGITPEERAIVEMWHRRVELNLQIPLIAVFVNTHELWADRRTQVPDWAEVCRADALKLLELLETELADHDFIAGDSYTIADITAQSALVLGKAVAGVRIAEDQPNLSAWWQRVTSRPTARA